MTDTIIARVALPFELKGDWQHVLRFRERLIEHVGDQLRTMRAVDFAGVSIELPLVGTVSVSFDSVPTLCKERGDIVDDVDIQIVLAHASVGTNGRKENKKAGLLRELPEGSWDEFWSRIYVDEAIKRRVLNYLLLARNLYRLAISNMCLAQHRIVLLFGPPGTGKTTLARGIANEAAKLFRGLGDPITNFVEIDAHRLSSKWLGETQRMVQEAFTEILDMAETGRPIICLFDEVESLLTNRGLSLGEGNPVDVYRAVNAVLQLMDRLAEHHNVFMLATSNLTNAIDPAFADRVDLSFVVDLPAREARAAILSDVARELAASDGRFGRLDPAWDDLLDATDGYSGRQLRKLVLEALTYDPSLATDPTSVTCRHILDAVDGRLKSAGKACYV